MLFVVVVVVYVARPGVVVHVGVASAVVCFAEAAVAVGALVLVDGGPAPDAPIQLEGAS